jgi:hypothetical protein
LKLAKRLEISFWSNTTILTRISCSSNVGGGYDDQEIANITLAW